MTFNDPTPLEPISDFKRDRYGRPLIMQADGTRKPYTRASSATRAIDDTWNLDQWDRRNVAYGVAHDSSLVARLLAIGGDPSTWNRDDKAAVGKVVDDARTIAKAHKGADIGTAVHRIIERRNRGEDIDAGPYQPDVDAYYTALAECGLTILPDYLEVRLVCDELELAGSADNILGRNGRHYIGDLKTGASVEFGVLGFAGQLAAYSNSHLYDVETEQRLPTPDLHAALGYIIHLPAGEGRCTIYELDLAAGYQAAKVAYEARRAQKAAKNWLTPCTTKVPSRADVIAALGGPDVTPDEGLTLADRHFDAVKAAFAALDDEQKQWFKETVASAKGALYFNATPAKTERRLHLYEGLITLARSGTTDDDVVRGLAYASLGTDAALSDLVDVGYVLGVHNAVQAAKFAQLAVRHVEQGAPARRKAS